MPISGKHPVLLAALLCGALLLVFGPAWGVEEGLLGIRIGASYRQLTQDFGQPEGILFPAGGGLLYQTVAAPAAPGLPQLAQQTTADAPVWVIPVRASALSPTQVQWVYDYTKTKGVSLGAVLSGEGADAVVTDVVVAGYPERLKGKPAPVRTQKGVVLGSTFSDVLKRYGYPPLIEIYAPPAGVAAGRAAGGGAAAMRVGAGMSARGAGRGRGGMGRGGMGRGGMGRGGMGRGGRGRGGRGRRGMAGGLGLLPPTPPNVSSTLTAQAPEFELVLTGRGRGGMGRGGMGRGGMGGRGGRGRGGMGGRGGRGRGGLPPLGTAGAAPAAADRFTAQAVVDHASIGFSRDCILTYEGIAFTLHDMKVFRIHVSE